MYELPTYYLLPLVGVNFKTLGVYKTGLNLKTTKINLKTNQIVCEVHSINNVPLDCFKSVSYKKIEGNTIIYKFPSHLTKTLDAFLEGRYSQIPESIKDWIIRYSGLDPRDDVIAGLYKKTVLKEKIERELAVKLSDDAELLEAPKATWFIEEKEEA